MSGGKLCYYGKRNLQTASLLLLQQQCFSVVEIEKRERETERWRGDDFLERERKSRRERW